MDSAEAVRAAIATVRGAAVDLMHDDLDARLRLMSYLMRLGDLLAVTEETTK